MVDKIKTQKCKYFNSGFCKFQSDCRFSHNENICTVINCKDKNCPNRHPKACRYREQCRRKTTCVYRHDENKLAEYEKLQSENKVLKKEISLLKFKLKATEEDLQARKKHEKETTKLLNENYFSEPRENVYHKINTMKQIVKTECHLCNSKFDDINSLSYHWVLCNLFCKSCKKCIEGIYDDGNLFPAETLHNKHQWEKIGKQMQQIC